MLHDVSLDVASGAVSAVVGPNGAGKSTLLNTIAGAVRPRRGTIVFDGASTGRAAPEDLAAQGIALVPEGRRIFAGLTVGDNLKVAAVSCGHRGAELEALREEVFALFPVLKERLGSAGGSLSGGQQQQLALGRALMTKPRLLLLDEPSLGLAPRVVDTVYEGLATLRARGMSMLLVEQNVGRALELAQHVFVLSSGRVTLSGTPAEVDVGDRLEQAYFGVRETMPS
ncbi:ABC transporter ATP-binding protein [Conexibacter sp. CPCC 206217]|uniref:ABC transporter ATP-binding protein n=1 Tax=Conexibacter sp. CPCC 206217 TaxID=3064574 RepID=UPI002715AA93|nr:ABC transporter ATP-binding protein [Conexibacter sp. CPCC 206217]MDO8208805.1 ABC transporter ATP-binding protein [Conexibacter sp. CPCC 206217]